MATYTQQSINPVQQIALLKSRGLSFGNEPRALHLLTHISLFRMKSYLLPFMSDKLAHVYKDHSSFEAAYELYRFDSELRKLVCSELEKIEVSIRTQFSLIMSEKFGPFWFTDANLFSDSVRHAKLLENIRNEVNRSDDDTIKHFYATYSNPFPPAWITMEVMSFGTLSMLYKNLRPMPEKRALATAFGLPDTVFESWLHCVVYVRNICAHHSRLWNKIMSIRPLYPKHPHNIFLNININNNRLYYLLSIIRYFQNLVTPNNTLPTRLNDLFLRYPQVNLIAMGFPAEWQSEPLWSHN